MTRRTHRKARIFLRLCLVISIPIAALVLVVVGATTLVMRQTSVKTPHATIAAKTATKKSSGQAAKTAPASGSSTPNLPNLSGNTADADKQTSIAAAAQPATDACKLLTLSAAKQLLGSGAVSSAPTDTSSMQASDTSLSACAYTSGSNKVQLAIRAPTSSLGKSENAAVFGSGKPSNAINVTGYGQAAFWNPDEHTLNILGDNNWYVITRGSHGSQADAETTAALLKSGF